MTKNLCSTIIWVAESFITSLDPSVQQTNKPRWGGFMTGTWKIIGRVLFASKNPGERYYFPMSSICIQVSQRIIIVFHIGFPLSDSLFGVNWRHKNMWPPFHVAEWWMLFPQLKCWFEECKPMTYDLFKSFHPGTIFQVGNSVANFSWKPW